MFLRCILDVKKPSLHQSTGSNGKSTFTEGSSTVLKCDVASSDPVNITWYFKNQNIISSAQNVHVDYLLLGNLRPEQSGHYTCRAKNLWGDFYSNKLAVDVSCKSALIFILKDVILTKI